VITAHGSDVAGYNPDRFSLMHSLMGPLWRMIVKNSSGITAPSNFLKNLIQKKIDFPVDVIPNGFDLRPIPDLVKENRILVVTRMFERKGVQFLFEALHGMQTDWNVWIVGDGPYLPVLKELAQNLDVSVRFFGQIPYDQIFQLYMTSKIYVFPSVLENFPVVLLEAMAAGCAVITTTAFGCAEVVGDAAIKVEPGSIEPLRHALFTLINNQQEIEKMAKLEQEQVKKFAWPIVTNEFEMLFRNLVV
jgi:glycosyltransferase involved in cell wall biosynthesis